LEDSSVVDDVVPVRDVAVDGATARRPAVVALLHPPTLLIDMLCFGLAA
jgi:hypothetical protein